MTPTEIEQARDALSALSSQLGQGLGDGNESIPELVRRIVGGIESHVAGRARILAAEKVGCGDCPQGPGGGLRDTFAMECGECRRFYGDLRQPAAKPL